MTKETADILRYLATNHMFQRIHTERTRKALYAESLMLEVEEEQKEKSCNIT